jgi:hypothetical protein
MQPAPSASVRRGGKVSPPRDPNSSGIVSGVHGHLVTLSHVASRHSSSESEASLLYAAHCLSSASGGTSSLAPVETDQRGVDKVVHAHHHLRGEGIDVSTRSSSDLSACCARKNRLRINTFVNKRRRHRPA